MDFGATLHRRHLTRSPSARERRTRPSTAVTAWWTQARLDRELADGADPATDSRRAHRARQLTRPRIRRRIAGSIECVMEEADGPWRGMSSEAPVQDRLVLDARPALQMLVDGLTTDGPVDPRGVALSLTLLTDAAGPLYRGEGSGALTRAALSAVDALRDGRRP